jgi:hypothetical protein
MPQHQHVLVTGSGAGGDQQLEAGQQPPPTAQAPVVYAQAWNQSVV